MTDKYRIIVLGAGFSRPAGLPLADELWQDIRTTATNYTGRAAKFIRDLKDYISFRFDCDGIKISPDAVNFEDFMRFLDIEHFLGLRGSETWSEDGNEATIVTKLLIGKILARHVIAHTEVPELYLEFARRLDVTDIVFTFNYDTLLERALEQIGKPFRLFSTRYETISDDGGGIVDDTRREVTLLKVHGSIDWFDRRHFEYRIEAHQKQAAPPPTDIIFSHIDALGLKPIVDGPRPNGDPLAHVYRAKNLAAVYSKDLLFMATPRILPPSAAKILYANKMNDFWEGMGSAGMWNCGMSIIGFSLPQQDEYAKQIIHSFVTNFQKYNKVDQLGRTALPLTIVDCINDSATEKAFRSRYRFVDWSKTNLIKTGFDLSSLDFIFGVHTEPAQI